ncbi:alginate export family protein [Nitrospinaceae bacterium]|nr:alginate export family protein [Nitrospinaceae bacterium]
MKKNLLTVAAMAVAVFFVSTEIAKAADITFSGQLRTRWEVNEHGANGGDGTVDNGRSFADLPDDSIFTSARLAATANINETTSAFIQLQSIRTWGQQAGGAQAGNNGGSGNASGTVSDGDASVGVHQAYFTLKNFLGAPLDAKVGRQEILLDGWRLFGNTIWTAGMQTHDAISFSHKHDNMSLFLAYISAVENDRTDDPNDSTDRESYLAHLNVKGVLGGQFSGYLNWDSNSSAAAAQTRANDIWTIGGRQAGKLAGLDYRGEYYYQFGNANGQKDGNVTTDADRSAYMYGLRLGKSFNNVSFKPSVTLWYDYLSGTNDEDQRDGEWQSFNTLWDTGHKFYGLQDVFLGVGGGGNTGTQGLGLQDLAVKTKINPIPGWTLKADYHWFFTAESAQMNTTTRGFTNAGSTGNLDDKLGNELDITAVTKMNANTKVMIGYSHFDATNTFFALKNGAVAPAAGTAFAGTDDADWAYVQFDVKF